MTPISEENAERTADRCVRLCIEESLGCSATEYLGLINTCLNELRAAADAARKDIAEGK